jgi:hypothetical protein
MMTTLFFYMAARCRARIKEHAREHPCMRMSRYEMAGDVNVMRTLAAENIEEGNHEYHIQYTSYTAGSWRGSVRLCGQDLAATAALLVTIRALDPTAACSRLPPPLARVTSHTVACETADTESRQAGPMRSRVITWTCVRGLSPHRVTFGASGVSDQERH